MIGDAIYTILTGVPEFTALAGDRVYPLRVAQSVDLPAVAYQTISNSPTNCKEGDAGLDRKRLQINIYAERYSHQEALAAIIREALSNTTGAIEGVDIADITYETETDLYENTAEIYFKTQDYTITINR